MNVLCNANATRMITISWKLTKPTSEEHRLNPLHHCSESMQIADYAFLLFIISNQCRFRAGMEHKTLVKLSAAWHDYKCMLKTDSHRGM